MPRKKWPESKSESEAPTEPAEEISRVFQTHTTKDGAEILDEQPPITDAPMPQDETLEAEPLPAPEAEPKADK